MMLWYEQGADLGLDADPGYLHGPCWPVELPVLPRLTEDVLEGE